MAEVQLTFGRTDDFVVVSKPKKGIAFVEARFNDGYTHTDKGCQQILALLQRELSPDKLNDDTIISLETDLLKDTLLYKDVPRDMFHSLRVVEFQGLDPSTRYVSARDVAIKINFYGLSNDSTMLSDYDMVTVLPSSKLDGLWELC
nr:thyroid receptor-interacting protein 13 [Colletotrichum truncatum]KAF6793275.1 thyroid receptor-interacting protein 13 [Colletotrichum truncatum]